MSKVCQKCDRGPQTGVSRSHAMNQTRRRFNLNLQTKTVDGKRMRLCTNCVKTFKKKARA